MGAAPRQANSVTQEQALLSPLRSARQRPPRCARHARPRLPARVGAKHGYWSRKSWVPHATWTWNALAIPSRHATKAFVGGYFGQGNAAATKTATIFAALGANVVWREFAKVLAQTSFAGMAISRVEIWTVNLAGTASAVFVSHSSHVATAALASTQTSACLGILAILPLIVPSVCRSTPWT